MSHLQTISNRGQRTLFTDLIYEKTETTSLKLIKGRNEDLLDLRNECLVTRYVYMMQLTGWRLDLLKRMLSKDFFLRMRTVEDILDANYQLVKTTRVNLPGKKEVEKKWPQYSWEMPDKNLYD